jgi:hypothetical protein
MNMGVKDQLEWDFLLEAQAGVVTHAQASGVGFSDKEIFLRLKSGRWRRLHHGVFATFTGKLSRQARLWEALLWAGKGALLSHQTAAELHELTSKQEWEIHITVPRSRRPLGREQMRGVAVHRSDLPIRRPAGPGKLAKTTVSDTVLDLVAAADTIEDAYSWISRAVTSGKASTHEIRLALQGRRRFPGKAWLEDALADVEDGVHFPLELRYARDVERPHGLPAAQRQAVRVIDGKAHRKDIWYPDYSICVELDGVTYHRDRRQNDRHRDNVNLAVDDVRTFRFEIVDLTQYACRTADLMATALRRAGWDGEPHRCREKGCTLRPGGLGRDIGQRATPRPLMRPRTGRFESLLQGRWREKSRLRAV